MTSNTKSQHIFALVMLHSYLLLLVGSFHIPVGSSFTIIKRSSSPSSPLSVALLSKGRKDRSDIITRLFAKKQSRSTLLNPPNDDDNDNDDKKRNIAGTTVTEEKKQQVEEEVYGTKFFGGSAVKEELFDEFLEEQADKLLSLYSSKSKATTAKTEGEEDSSMVQSYSRFSDEEAFEPSCRNFAQVLQAAINQALYLPPLEQNQETLSLTLNQLYSPLFEWKTPLSRAKDSKNPLDELTNSLNFFKRVDVAIISVKKKIGNDSNDKSGNNDNVNNLERMQIRWEISVIWPNIWESRVLLSGTSDVTVDMDRMIIMSQTDHVDCGGKDGQDMIQAIASQIQPRFWDLYHIGMTPSAEIMPRMNPGSDKKGGVFSNYRLFEIPPRLVLQPTIVDNGGRDAREAEAIPNHAFTCAIKTSGPKAQRYTTTSPVEVSIRRLSGDQSSSSVITWNIPLTPEFVSYYDELPLGDVTEDDDGATNKYCYQPKRLVATLPFGGFAQDKGISDVRKKLYEQITRDGLKPKLLDGAPQFFFLNNDTKACFTADGGLGMVVYEWRPQFAQCNEVGIELELE